MENESIDDLDALVAAPAHHQLLFENEKVRALDTQVAPGETVPLHTHTLPAVLYVISWSPFVRRDESGVVMVDSRASGFTAAPGQALWSGPLGPHTLENVGTNLLHVVAVELKESAEYRG